MKYIKTYIITSIFLITAISYTGHALLTKSNTPKTNLHTEPYFNKSSQSKPDTPHGTIINDSNNNIWIPTPKTSWQWQLSTPVDQTVDAQMFDIDMFSNDASVVQALQAQGKHVVCYISAGSVEDWRPDAATFPSEVVGKDYAG